MFPKRGKAPFFKIRFIGESYTKVQIGFGLILWNITLYSLLVKFGTLIEFISGMRACAL